ncbi:hypothetical protein [Bacteroides acidifaciens]|uniref:hypothetical protein n=1 Tax=Bacteroides acidifaciens TaxID=85831 RepID=UPI00263BB999|nr:hypothetical protein [Bacteroides acidifaciens]
MKQKKKRGQRSFKDQLNDINIELFGRPLPSPRKAAAHKYNDEVQINKRASRNIDVPGFGPRKVCNITMGTIPIDYEIDPNRLDAPCDVCINMQCPYAMGLYDINNLKNWGFRKGTKEPIILDYKEEK